MWNPGERVEGYTNFLWVLLGALFLKTGLGAITALQTVSALAILLTLLLTWKLARLIERPGASMAPPAVIWLLAAESVGYYATTAMETALFTCLATLAIYLALREARDRTRHGAVAVFIGLTLTRPEGLMLFGLGQGVSALLERFQHGTWGFKRRAVDALIYAVAIGAWIAWRFTYYGEILPNTYHAKVTGGAEQLSGGLLYLRDWLLIYPVFTLALLAPVVLLGHHFKQSQPSRSKGRHPRSLPQLAAVWLLALAWVVYVVTVGADSMPFHRFLVPILPLVAILTNATLNALPRIWPRLGQSHLLGLTAFLLAVQLGAGRLGEEPMRAFVAHRTTLVGLETGRYLAAELDSNDLLAVNTAGALPWASRLPSLDMLGLTEPTIARHGVYVVSPRWSGHRRGWGEHVLSRQPGVIVWYNSAGAREPHYLGDHQLADDPYFRFFYQLRRAELPAVGTSVADQPSEMPSRALARFPGAPFGTGKGDGMISPNLGLRFEIKPRPLAHTIAYNAPITFHYFELRPVNRPLWPLRQTAGGDLERFLDAATRHWRADATPFDPEARRDVEHLCEEAVVHVRAGRTDAAKAALSRAATRNATARSPLVGQYVANLAVTEKNLFLAVQAQLEALRLAPDNALYRSNLQRLLTVPYKDFSTADPVSPSHYQRQR